MKTLTSPTTVLSGLVLAALVSCATTEVTPPAYVGDNQLVGNVQAAMAQQTGLNPTEITVQSMDGEVTLSGFLDSPDQIDKAVATARSVNGVKVVKNEMRLK